MKTVIITLIIGLLPIYMQAQTQSFAQYLRNLPLSKSTVIKIYDGRKLHKNNSRAVICDFGTKANEQCADALIYLRSKYLWQNKEYSKISFHFVNGFKCDYIHWANGYRVNKKHNGWIKTAKKDYSYRTFRRYLSYVFEYANTWSLWKYDMVRTRTVDAGTVFMACADPVYGALGHCFMVVDKKVVKGQIYCKIAQGYTPAQQIEVFNEWVPYCANPMVRAIRTPDGISIGDGTELRTGCILKFK